MTDFEKQREGAMILIDSDEVEYFQVFARTHDGPIALSGARETADADFEVFLGQMLRILSDSKGCSMEEMANRGIKQAKQLQPDESSP